MSKKFTETPIPLCGKELYFKRCPVSAIKEYDQKIQDKVKELKPIEEEREALEDEVKMLQQRIENLQKKVDLIDRKEDPTDAELEMSIKILDKQEPLYDELKEAKKKQLEFSETHEDDYNKVGEAMNEIIADKVEAMLNDITAKEFLADYDVVDMRIATNLSRYYEMCIIGEKSAKIQKQIKRDSQEHNERIDGFRG